MKEKTLEERIFELRETIRQVIIQSELSPSIVELILRDIYTDLKQLSEQNLMRIINEKKKEGENNGEHSAVS